MPFPNQQRQSTEGKTPVDNINIKCIWATASHKRVKCYTSDKADNSSAGTIFFIGWSDSTGGWVDSIRQVGVDLNCLLVECRGRGSVDWIYV